MNKTYNPYDPSCHIDDFFCHDLRNFKKGEMTALCSTCKRFTKCRRWQQIEEEFDLRPNKTLTNINIGCHTQFDKSQPTLFEEF